MHQPDLGGMGKLFGAHNGGDAVMAGIGQRWLGLERVMGIEYIAGLRLLS
jgi:hypothetical protein